MRRSSGAISSDMLLTVPNDRFRIRLVDAEADDALRMDADERAGGTLGQASSPGSSPGVAR